MVMECLMKMVFLFYKLELNIKFNKISILSLFFEYDIIFLNTFNIKKYLFQ